MKNALSWLVASALLIAAAILLYEFGKYPGEKFLMNTWKGE